jgi:surfeit locus 1 family protein
MLSRFKTAGLIGPTLFALAGLGLLIGLGTWQLQRKAWKEGLLERIAARVTAEPVPLARALEIWHGTGDVEYLHVRLAGHFLHQRERHVYAIDSKLGPGFHIYTPFVTATGWLALVNRGFVPEKLKDPSSRSAGQIAGNLEVTGLIRRPTSQPLFAPASDAARNMYFWPDYTGMLESTKPNVPAELKPLPFFIDADANSTNPGGWPQGGTTRLILPNRHLEYAITWFGMALALIGVYLSFAYGRLRRFSGEKPR